MLESISAERDIECVKCWQISVQSRYLSKDNVSIEAWLYERDPTLGISRGATVRPGIIITNGEH